MAELTQKELKQQLSYNPDDGSFFWIEHGKKRVGGKSAGNITARGYVSIMINYKNYLAHRLAFLYITGKFPFQIDHINNERSDNRWHNLRTCTTSQNCGNAKIKKNNTSGYKGVSWSKVAKKWLAEIFCEGKHYFLGYHHDKIEAAEAYNHKALELFGEFAYINDLGAGTPEQYIEHAKEFV